MVFGDQRYIDLAELDQEARRTACRQLGARLERIQEEWITSLCGPRYKRDNESRYARAGTRKRWIITELGLVRIRLARIRDKETRERSTPLLGLLGLKKRQRYCPDVRQSCADLAVKVSYRDASETYQQTTGNTPAQSSVHRFVQEAGPGMARINSEHVRSLVEEWRSSGEFLVLEADGTKIHSNTGKGKKNDARVVIARGGDGPRVLLSSSVNRPWGKISHRVSVLDLPRERCVLVGDAEPAIRSSFKDWTAAYQLCVLHVTRAVNFKLWKRKQQLPAERRLALVRDLTAILFRLVGSVKKHLLAPDPERLRQRITEALKALNSFVLRLREEGSASAAGFVSRSIHQMVVFARLALEQVRIPYTTNLVERLMGEVAKRVKNRWAHWSERGLNNLLALLLVRYTNRKLYKAAWKTIYHPTGDHTTKTPWSEAR